MMWSDDLGPDIAATFARLSGCFDGGAGGWFVDPESRFAVVEARLASDPAYRAELSTRREARRAERLAADPVAAERRRRQKARAAKRAEVKRLVRLKRERAARRAVA